MRRSRTILLVEDNADDEALTLRAFARSGRSGDCIVVVRDGVEALDWLFRTNEHAARPEGTPDVVLLDINLPLVDGLQVLQRMRADPRTRRIPVVMLTSSGEERDLVASYDLGANSFVRKPVDFDRFVEAAGQLGLYWLALNEPAPA